jgi:hypothetical protein
MRILAHLLKHSLWLLICRHAQSAIKELPRGDAEKNHQDDPTSTRGASVDYNALCKDRGKCKVVMKLAVVMKSTESISLPEKKGS